MIAFKDYSQCPVNSRPLNIPLSWPWVQKACTEEEVEDLVKNGWTVLSEAGYSDYLAARDEEMTLWLAGSQQAQAIETVKGVILSPAKSFGLSIIDQFAAENILLGITQAGMTNQVRKNTAQVIAALSTGSLYDAIYEARQIPAEAKDPVFVTDARLLTFVNIIEEYLGAPKSTSL